MTTSVDTRTGTGSLRRLTLDNGLRVVLDPRHMAPVVGVAVHYGVGFRGEPEGRTGFAHLFEHLMFQGSEHVGRSEHFWHVQSAGGMANASTHQDFTDYHQVVPSAALERVLFLEADRMRSPRLTAENLRTQVEVVKEEVRLNVANRPYGGFPWTVLPGLLYRTFPNAHNGYGAFHDLEQATVEECETFFADHYAPANAVLTVSGSFDPGQATAFVERHFAGIPYREPAAPAPLAEPHPADELHGVHRDGHAPLPAVALGYRLPDPAGRTDDYLAHMILASVLASTPDTRLPRRLQGEHSLVTGVQAACGLFGPLQARDPDTFQVVATLHGHTATEDLLAAVDEELASLAAHGPSEDELARATARASARTARAYDSLLTSTRHLGSFELLHGRAELVRELPGRLAAVGPEAVVRAARRLGPGSRAVLSLVPGTPGTPGRQ
ncbi:M16 family metallopeptidase [Streptomyces bacillaris]|uniref:M16 family metallopeptidase n=1 Tax=Streptomyces bacillaris TaxID=68179 RepID=UPI00380BC63C